MNIKGICPVCNGSKRNPATGAYKTIIAGYDKATDTFACNNCGGQYMSGTATGEVRLNKTGEPCTHEYIGSSAGRCYHRYDCKHCGETYYIDSGD